MISLIGQKQKDELKALKKCPYIQSMFQDLKLLGETSESLRKASNFNALNNRYCSLSGERCLTLGSVLNAICSLYEEQV